MAFTRRDLSFLLPLLAAGEKRALPSKAFEYGTLPVRENGQNRSRAILDGETHTGFAVEAHETELAPGMVPHAPHHHDHEELIVLREGTLEVTIAGNTTKLGPGSVIYIASNEEHGSRNVGTDRAKYVVITLGRSRSV